jgi:hypothetical protein
VSRRGYQLSLEPWDCVSGQGYQSALEPWDGVSGQGYQSALEPWDGVLGSTLPGFPLRLSVAVKFAAPERCSGAAVRCEGL